MNQSNNSLQLQVDVFCRDVCSGVNEWLESNSFSNGELNSLLTVSDFHGNPITS